MISSQLHQELQGFDEIVRNTDGDFTQSGLRTTSLIRVARLAVASGEVFLGSMGEISPDRLSRIRKRLADWIRKD